MVPYNLASDCCWRLVIKQSAFGKLIVKLVGVDKQPGSGFVLEPYSIISRIRIQLQILSWIRIRLLRYRYGYNFNIFLLNTYKIFTWPVSVEFTLNTYGIYLFFWWNFLDRKYTWYHHVPYWMKVNRKKDDFQLFFIIAWLWLGLLWFWLLVNKLPVRIIQSKFQ